MFSFGGLEPQVLEFPYWDGHGGGSFTGDVSNHLFAPKNRQVPSSHRGDDLSRLDSGVPVSLLGDGVP